MMAQPLAYSGHNNFASVIHNINRELQDKGFLQSTTEDGLKMADTTKEPLKPIVSDHHLMTEMRGQNFDVIRFATYRTACKLRYIQKKTNLHHVDVWNMIESFRENNLNTLEPQSELNVSRLETTLSSIFTQLNKRLPVAEVVDVDQSTSLLLNWLLMAFDKENKGRLQVFSLKVALSHLCAGKLVDKLRYIFTQVSDSSGHLSRLRFEDYLRHLLALPTAVYEGPSFGYTESCSRSCFDGKARVTVTDFLDVLMSDPGPQCLMWLPILFRMSQVDSVVHGVQCEGCHRESFTGFRYKCQRCYNYQLCQDCFWRGRTSGNHRNDHKMKEYTAYKASSKRIGKSLQKSLHCIPTNQKQQKTPKFIENPEIPVEPQNTKPVTPVLLRNGYPEPAVNSSYEVTSVDSGSLTRSPNKVNSVVIEGNNLDDEHRLIARYAARLAADTSNVARSPAELNFALDSNKQQRELIFQLEAKNKEIMTEIHRLRIEQEAQNSEGHDAEYNPTLLTELRLLRQRKQELESRMQALQESRMELMVQLEGLMKLLKNHNSPRSTPNSSPCSRRCISPTSAQQPLVPSPNTPLEALAGVGGDVRQAFHQTSTGTSADNVRNLRNDLLVAADSVTNAMSSLVKELNSDQNTSGDMEANCDHYSGANGFESTIYSNQSSDETALWRAEVERRLGQEKIFIAELRARRDRGSSQGGSRNQSDTEDMYQSVDESDIFLRHDDDPALITDDFESSYIRTDDESNVRTTDDDEPDTFHRSRHRIPPPPPTAPSANKLITDEDSCLQTDDESYIRTDDEEGGNTDWEDAMKRWVNR